MAHAELEPDRGGRRRVAVTGLGVVSCCGIGKDAFFAGLNGPAPEGEHRVRGFDSSLWFDAKEVRRVDLFAQFAVAAAEMALEDAGQLDVDPALAGIQIGTGVGGLSTMEAQIGVLLEKGPRRVSPFLVPMMMANAGGATVSMRLGWRGPCETITTACASGTHSILAGHRLIATGRCDAVLAGGAEAAMTPVALAAFGNMTALSTSGQSRPFDVRRDGFVIAEGGAVLVLEELERALSRGAHIYAELLGGASSADAHHITAGDIAHVNAHGTSTPLNDMAEAEAIDKIFGRPGPLVTSIKGVTGHSLGAAGALEGVACALSIDRRLIPPTVGLEQQDPEIHLDIVRDAPREWEPGPVLSNSFGFGGHNGCIVLAPTSA